MTVQRLQDTTVVRPLPRPDATRTMLCLGFCGGGTGPFRPWLDVLGEDTELALLCYPGREGRFAEDFAPDWDALAEDATDAVALAMAEAPDRAFQLFGHSMGGWMAFDVAVRLAERGAPLPEGLIVSACNAPDRGVTERDRFPRIEDTEGRLLEWMRTTGLLPAHAADDPDLREMAVELMRADITVRDSYRPRPGVTTTVPVHLLHGEDDEVIEPSVAEEWARCATGGLTVTALPGTHFYTRTVWAELPRHFGTGTDEEEHA
ncbi:thioesterase II family protein [Kitasatospora sp. NPDC101157]|uniref:thioesterase II family protein n=1 Tax=Kitasatospora sp. NPDC101157 TaxID=3364098 RepID=UPI0037FBB24F